MNKAFFNRTRLLFGDEKMSALSKKRVIIFGVGGVGSWCAESLIRTGIEELTIVDSDRVCMTNINRQLMATSETIGQVKAEVLKKRLLEINPAAKINALQKIYSAETSHEFELHTYDYIIDAIDTLYSKMHLMREACKTNAQFLSSMGAALRIDPSRVKVAPFWEVKGCHFARKIRKDMRKGELPAKNFLCVYSDELLENLGEDPDWELENSPYNRKEKIEGDPNIAYHNWSKSKAVVNGSLAHMTAIFGFTLAGLIIEDIYKTTEKETCQNAEIDNDL